jgi:hypothetical protein
MAKAARLNSKRFRRPAATRIGELRYAEKGASLHRMRTLVEATHHFSEAFGSVIAGRPINVRLR